MKKLFCYLTIVLLITCATPTENQLEVSEGSIVNVANYLHCSIEIVLDEQYKGDITQSCDSCYCVIDDGKHVLLIRTIPAGWEDFINFQIFGGDTIKFVVTSSGIRQDN